MKYLILLTHSQIKIIIGLIHDDGIPDEEDYDADGDGFDWFNYIEDGIDPEDVFDDSVTLDPDGIITNQQQKIDFEDLKESMTGIAVDLLII